MLIVNDQLDQYRHVTGQTMEDEAHAFPGWKHAWQGGKGNREPVPFESVFWDDRKALQDWEEEHALSLAHDLR
jgi:hypothetical protein